MSWKFRFFKFVKSMLLSPHSEFYPSLIDQAYEIDMMNQVLCLGIDSTCRNGSFFSQDDRQSEKHPMLSCPFSVKKNPLSLKPSREMMEDTTKIVSWRDETYIWVWEATCSTTIRGKKELVKFRSFCCFFHFLFLAIFDVFRVLELEVDLLRGWASRSCVRKNRNKYPWMQLKLIKMPVKSDQENKGSKSMKTWNLFLGSLVLSYQAPLRRVKHLSGSQLLLITTQGVDLALKEKFTCQYVCCTEGMFFHLFSRVRPPVRRLQTPSHCTVDFAVMYSIGINFKNQAETSQIKDKKSHFGPSESWSNRYGKDFCLRHH